MLSLGGTDNGPDENPGRTEGMACAARHTVNGVEDGRGGNGGVLSAKSPKQTGWAKVAADGFRVSGQ
jgi:hypothetical protein